MSWRVAATRHIYLNRLLKQDLHGKRSEGDFWRLSCFMALLDMSPKAKDPWFRLHHGAQFFISLCTLNLKPKQSKLTLTNTFANLLSCALLPNTLEKHLPSGHGSKHKPNSSEAVSTPAGSKVHTLARSLFISCWLPHVSYFPVFLCLGKEYENGSCSRSCPGY